MYDYSCDWKSGFVMDPIKKQRFGYLVSLDGFGLDAALPRDIEVYMPFNETVTYEGLETAEAKGGESSSTKKVKVVGVIDHWSWGGGVGDPICISAYLSAENANQIQVKQQATLKTTVVKDFSWWIGNFDEEEKKWFEEAHPAKGNKTCAGQLNAPGKTDIRLAVAKEAVKIAANIDVNVYNVYFEIVPAANQTYDLKFAASASKTFIKGWGLKVGTQAAAAMGGKT